MGGELKLNKKQATEFGAFDYASLPEALSDAFDDYEIEYDEITDATDEELKEFFQRLQQGLPLTSSEKLNSVHSKLRDYCVKAAKSPFFKKTIVVSNKRYAHFDIAAKVAAIEIEGLDVGLRFEDVKKVFESNSAFSAQSAAARRINNALKYLHKRFPAKYAPFRNRTVVQSVITLVCHLQQAGLKAQQELALKRFIDSFLGELRKQVELGLKATDHDFLAFQRTVNANVKTGARTRQAIFLSHLFRKHPEFFSVMSHSAEIADSLRAGRERLANNIRELISSINERYASNHGKDLFKPTNKSATALAGLGKRLASLQDYQKFVEQLYFVFRESLGQRLAGQLPDSFKHVNDLRTMLQHDVDHGKTRDVAKKRKHLASVFKTYSGATSPDAIAPSTFTLVQVNILGAVNADLTKLSGTLS